MAGRDSDDDSDTEWALPKQLEWYKSKANMISSNSILQTNVREGYRITTLEVVELIEDLISYLLKSLRSPTLKDWLAVAKCIRLRNAQILKVFYEAAAGTIWTIMLAKSSSVVSNRSTALITDKFSVALLTELAILNNANVALVDAVHYSVVIDALTMTLIKDDDDLLGTVNSYIKLRRLGARCKTEAADSRYAKASGGRTKKDKDLEDFDTGSDVLRLRRRDRAAACARLAKRKRLGKEAQLKKTRDEEELAKAKKEKEEKEAWERETYSSDIDPEDNLEDEEATTAKDLAREQKERLKALLNANGIFANAIGMGKTRAIVLAVLIGHVYFKNWTEVQNAQAEGDAIEYNAVDDDDKLYPTEGERTFYCACERSPSFNAEPRQAAIIMTGWGRAANAWKNKVCDLSDLLALRFCFFSDSPLENIGRLTKEEAIEMRIDTTDAIFKALAAANKLVALQSYIIPEANTPAVHSEATKHRLALLAAQFVIVCGFRKVDKHVDILEKEGLNELEASRRVIFNCFEMQAIASYSALATLKAAQFKTYGSCKVKRFTLNSVKDLFTNLSKDYFLVREARAITKSSLNIAAEDVAKAANTLLPLKEVCAKILIGSYKLIVQALAEMYVGIVYFNLDSELELKVLEALC
ncbi:hypothetical protein HBH50_056970 [Parastagonospora nodorum]|nr:hypothetical protein HBH50_056970 [Parastagonospora nodorum]KAH4089068.1 hypothetical protein HBH48_122960 [Parastagonospora nodorum]